MQCISGFDRKRNYPCRSTARSVDFGRPIDRLILFCDPALDPTDPLVGGNPPDGVLPVFAHKLGPQQILATGQLQGLHPEHWAIPFSALAWQRAIPAAD